MTLRSLGWTAAFALPLALAAAAALRLHRERAALIRDRDLGIQTAARLEQSRQSAVRMRQHARENAAQTAGGPAPSPAARDRLAMLATLAELAASGGGRRGGPGAIPITNTYDRPFFPALMGDPAYARAVLVLARQQTERDYGRLLAALNLPPADQARLEDELTGRRMAAFDAMGGLGVTSGSDEVVAAERGTVLEVDGQIQAEFGDTVWRQLQAYDDTYHYTAVIDTLQNQLSYTATPLAPEAADQLADLLKRAVGQRMRTPFWITPDSVIRQASAFLSPDQLTALQTVQARQQADFVMYQRRRNGP